MHMTDHINDINARSIHTLKFVIENISWHFLYSHQFDPLGMFLKFDDVLNKIVDVTARIYLFDSVFSRF